MTKPLRVSAERTHKGTISTGIYVRAILPDNTYAAVDIAQLDTESLLTWLRSRGGSNPWAENTVAIILGHVGFLDSPYGASE